MAGIPRRSRALPVVVQMDASPQDVDVPGALSLFGADRKASVTQGLAQPPNIMAEEIFGADVEVQRRPGFRLGR
jgi:hypothetical protein